MPAVGQASGFADFLVGGFDEVAQHKPLLEDGAQHKLVGAAPVGTQGTQLRANRIAELSQAALEVCCDSAELVEVSEEHHQDVIVERKSDPGLLFLDSLQLQDQFLNQKRQGEFISQRSRILSRDQDGVIYDFVNNPISGDCQDPLERSESTQVNEIPFESINETSETWLCASEFPQFSKQVPGLVSNSLRQVPQFSFHSRLLRCQQPKGASTLSQFMNVLQDFHNLRHDNNPFHKLLTDLGDFDELLNSREHWDLARLESVDDLQFLRDNIVGLVDFEYLLDLDDFVFEYFDLFDLRNLGKHSDYFLLVDLDDLDHLIDDGHGHVVLDCVLEDLVYFDEVWDIYSNLHVFGNFNSLLDNPLDLYYLWDVHNLFHDFLDDLRNLHNFLNNFPYWDKFLNCHLDFLNVFLDNNFGSWN